MGGDAVSGGWQVGDLALCVDARVCPAHLGNGGLIEGRVYIVAAINIADSRSVLHGDRIGLLLNGVNCIPSAPNGFASARFRKIKPDAEPCEEEFTVLIKRMKPAKVKS